MPVAQLADNDIEELIRVPKPLPADYRNRLRTRARPYSSQHEEAQLDVPIENRGTFRVIVRRNRINPMDFCVILGYVPPERTRLFRLRRYNGSHRHTNKLEGTDFHGCHVHYATQRYQEAGWDIDAYAEATERYGTADQALELLLDECNFVRPETERLRPKLF